MTKMGHFDKLTHLDAVPSGAKGCRGVSGSPIGHDWHLRWVLAQEIGHLEKISFKLLQMPT